MPPPSRLMQVRSEREPGADLEVAALARDSKAFVRFVRRSGAIVMLLPADPHRILAIDEVERIQRLEVEGQLLIAIPRHLERLRNVEVDVLVADAVRSIDSEVGEIAT